MRSEDGKHFENVVGIKDKAWDAGEEFVASVFDCNKRMNAGDEVMVRDRLYHYHGEDSLGRSIFTLVGQPIADVLFCP
jgi:hypothetical protein